jgi:CelD/BcsL family acetyltransferase involved in cellulose biosynthesis
LNTLPLLRYEIVTDLAAAESIAPLWNELLDRSICNRAFSSPIWFIAACKVQPELEPWLMLAWRGESLAGVLPLAIRSEAAEAIFPSSRSDYHDIVVAEGDMAAAEGLLERAFSERAQFRGLQLTGIRQDSNLAAAFIALTRRKELTGCCHVEQECSYITLGATHAQYLNSRSSAFRKGANRTRRKAAAAGLAMRDLTAADLSPEHFLELFFSLHFSRFQARSAFRPGTPNFSFAKLALPALFAERRLHVLAVQEEKRIVAVDLLFCGARSLCAWNGGYSPEAECWSPGRLLLLFGMERARELGLEEYDLLRGTQAWKARWANGRRIVQKIVVER